MPRFTFVPLLAAAAIVTAAQSPSSIPTPTLTPQKSGTTQLLIAVYPVNTQVVWASGTGGTYVVTTDGGAHWKSAVVPGAENLQFRDVYGVSDTEAYLLSIGNFENNFRIYKTIDGGATWTIEFQNERLNAFYDCFGFWTPDRGIAHTDSVNGVFYDYRTTNGATWESISKFMPPALPGEASFAASGTCVATEGTENAWVATGGSTIARILATKDGGNSWNAYDTPLVSSPSAGAISVAFRDASHGMVGGGDLSCNELADTATSDDGGQTWNLTTKPPVKGSVFCLAYACPKESTQFAQYERVVVITTETVPNYTAGDAAWTPDEGHTWYTLSGVSGYWAVGFANPTAGWFVGNNGQILKISF